MNKQKCLSVLNLETNPTNDEIKKAYKMIALKTHPDKIMHLDDNIKDEMGIKFKEASEAYQRLTNDDFGSIFEDFNLDDIFDNMNDMNDMSGLFGNNKSMSGLFGNNKNMSGLFGNNNSMKMFSGLATKMFENQSFQSIFKSKCVITYFDLINKRKFEKNIIICGIPTIAMIDCGEFPKQIITRSFQGLSSTVEITFELESDSIYSNKIHNNGNVDLIYEINISHYKYYKGFVHNFEHIDGSDVSFNVKKMSKKSLKIKKRGLNNGDLIIKIILKNPVIKEIANDDYEIFLKILKEICDE